MSKLSSFVLVVVTLVCARDLSAQSKPVDLQILNPPPLKNDGLLLPGNWDLVLRVDIDKVEYFLSSPFEDGLDTGEVVYDDPDGIPPVFGASDELGVKFSTEGPDSAGVVKESAQTCSHLVDDHHADLPIEMLNKSYLLADDPSPEDDPFFLNPGVIPVGQFTGGDVVDCFGYGRDDSLPSLVLMVDVGGARVFDPFDNVATGRIRNLAGFIELVGIEVVTSKSGAAITASIRADGQFEPVIVADYAVSGHFLKLKEDGAEFTFESEQLFEDWQDRNRFVTLRAVVVEGDAPDFIDDMDGDGEYTAYDVELAGYNVISNEAQLEIVTRDITFSECPWHKDLWYVADLDGNGEAGNHDADGDGIANELLCTGGNLVTTDTGGSRSVIRIRR